jgi:site-specific recombinase
MGYALLGAAVAGVWLFVAGLVTGWYDNRCAVLDVPGRIRGSPLLRWMGSATRDRFATYMGDNLGALVGNAVFGVLLGATGFVGFLLGLPIDIRHVAFASANLGYAAITLDLAAGAFATGLVFVLMIGAVNLVVSFSLALRVALRSRDVNFNRARALASETLALLRREPRSFFLPPPT